jgi:hypothetical protein
MANKNHTTTGIPLEELVTEAMKVEVQIKALSEKLNNPELDLGASVRMNVQRRELEAYLAGLLYVLGELPPREICN